MPATDQLSEAVLLRDFIAGVLVICSHRPSLFGDLSDIRCIVYSDVLINSYNDSKKAETLMSLFDMQCRFFTTASPADAIPGLSWDQTSTILEGLLTPVEENPMFLFGRHSVAGADALRYCSAASFAMLLGQTALQPAAIPAIRSGLYMLANADVLDDVCPDTGSVPSPRTRSRTGKDAFVPPADYLTAHPLGALIHRCGGGDLEFAQRASSLVKDFLRVPQEGSGDVWRAWLSFLRSPVDRYGGEGGSDSETELVDVRVSRCASSVSDAAPLPELGRFAVPLSVRYELSLALPGCEEPCVPTPEAFAGLALPRDLRQCALAQVTLRERMRVAYLEYLRLNNKRWTEQLPLHDERAVHFRKDSGFLLLRTQRVLKADLRSVVSVVSEINNHHNWVPGAIEALERGRIGYTSVVFEQYSRLAILPKRRIGCHGLGINDTKGRLGAMLVSTMPLPIGTTHVNGHPFFPHKDCCTHNGDPTCFILLPLDRHTTMVEIYSCITVGTLAQSAAFSWVVDPLINKIIDAMFEKLSTLSATAKHVGTAYQKAMIEKRDFYSYIDSTMMNVVLTNELAAMSREDFARITGGALPAADADPFAPPTPNARELLSAALEDRAGSVSPLALTDPQPAVFSSDGTPLPEALVRTGPPEARPRTPGCCTCFGSRKSR